MGEEGTPDRADGWIHIFERADRLPVRRVELALYHADRTLIASTGAPVPPPPEPKREESGWGHANDRPRLLFRLPDGRWLSARAPCNPADTESNCWWPSGERRPHWRRHPHRTLRLGAEPQRPPAHALSRRRLHDSVHRPPYTVHAPRRRARPGPNPRPRHHSSFPDSAHWRGTATLRFASHAHWLIPSSPSFLHGSHPCRLQTASR